MRSIIFKAAFFWLSCSSIAGACELSGKEWADSVNSALHALGSGNGQKFKTIILKSINQADEKEIDTLIKNLDEYAPNGFTECRELMRVDIPPLATKILFELVNANNNGIYFYVFLIDGKLSYRSGIQRFRITTQLEDALSDWGNP